MTIGLHRSFLGGAGLAIVHGAAAAVVLATPWQSWPKGLLLVGLAVSAFLAWRLWNPPVSGLRLLADGRIECRLAAHQDFLSAELLPGATVHRWLVVVRLKLADATVAVVALPDSISREEFRRLRVWLRWRADFSPGTDAA